MLKINIRKLMGYTGIICAILICVIPAQVQSKDAWQALRKEFKLDHSSANARVKHQIKRFTKHKHELKRLTARATPYLHYILCEVKKRNMPGEIALIPMIESGFDPFAYSRVGAAGIWQIMPGTASGLGLKHNYWRDGRRDIKAATNATLNYLTYLHKFFDGDWSKAIAAYNSGEGNVRKAIRRNKNSGKSTSYWALPVPKETKYYVPRLYAIAEIINNPQDYQVELPEIPNKPYFTSVNVGEPIDLTHAAKLADMELNEFHELNSAHNRWITEPDGPHVLLIPTDKARSFKINLKRHARNGLVKWKTHSVKDGESLQDIAKRYNSTATLIQKTNDIKSKDITSGTQLRIPHQYLVSPDDPSWKSSANRIKHNIGPQKIVHVVKDGETVKHVAAQYNTRAGALVYWNKISENATLETGQELVVWSKKKKRVSNCKISNARVHKVKKGESLDKIARLYGVKIKDLKRWNKVKLKKYIFPGQSLVVRA